MDLEARLHSEHPNELRLWLRMLTCTQLIEQRIRARLREQFGITLARFDLMAQLERAPDGLPMSALSKRMMVTGGNITGLTDELVKEGSVVRRPLAGDRRVHCVCLTPKGRREFKAMAVAHEAWVVESFAHVPSAQLTNLHRVLGALKTTQQENR